MNLSFIQSRREGYDHILELGFTDPTTGLAGVAYSFRPNATGVEVVTGLQEMVRLIERSKEAPDLPRSVDEVLSTFERGAIELMRRLPADQGMEEVCRINPVWFEIMYRQLMSEMETRCCALGPPMFKGVRLIPDDRVRSMEFSVRIRT